MLLKGAAGFYTKVTSKLRWAIDSSPENILRRAIRVRAIARLKWQGLIYIYIYIVILYILY